MSQSKEEAITEEFIKLVQEICDENDAALKELVNK